MNYYNIHTSDLEQYVVKPGDSLYMIAKRYNVPIDSLLVQISIRDWWNGRRVLMQCFIRFALVSENSILVFNYI